VLRRLAHRASASTEVGSDGSEYGSPQVD
jgi:hypothetical protein